MFNQVGWGEIIVLLLVGLFVFGPDRLPKVARDAGRMLRELRQMAANAQNDIRSELGPEFADLDIRSLHPKAFVQKHLLGDDDDDDPLLPPLLTKRTPLPRNPLDLPDVKSFLGGDPPSNGNGSSGNGQASLTKFPVELPSSRRPTSPAAGPAPFDTDAT